jgi:hypothetical protein
VVLDTRENLLSEDRVFRVAKLQVVFVITPNANEVGAQLWADEACADRCISVYIQMGQPNLESPESARSSPTDKRVKSSF